MSNNNKIGYGNPPEDTRFKKGESGNVKGRPRGSKSTYKLLDDLLGQNVEIVQNGKKVKIPKKTAMLLQAVNAAVKGDLKALQIILPHLIVADVKEEDKNKTRQKLKQNDKAILELFIKNNSSKEEDSDE